MEGLVCEEWGNVIKVVICEEHVGQGVAVRCCCVLRGAVSTSTITIQVRRLEWDGRGTPQVSETIQEWCEKVCRCYRTLYDTWKGVHGTGLIRLA